jgi:uncharacterized membrane protein YgcG
VTSSAATQVPATSACESRLVQVELQPALADHPLTTRARRDHAVSGTNSDSMIRQADVRKIGRSWLAMRNKVLRFRRGRVRSLTVVIGSAMLAVIAGTGVALGTRPKPPPPSDSAAGRHAVAFCRKGIEERAYSAIIEYLIPGGSKVAKAIDVGEPVVKGITSWQLGEYENSIYDFVRSALPVLTESGVLELELVGAIGPAWLSCGEALQYYEQEKAKDVARTLQRWAFGAPKPPSQAAGPRTPSVRISPSAEPSSISQTTPTADLPLPTEPSATGVSRGAGSPDSNGEGESQPGSGQSNGGTTGGGGSSGEPSNGGMPSGAASPVAPPLLELKIERAWTRNSAGVDQVTFSCGDQVRLSLSITNPNRSPIVADIAFLADNSSRSLYNYDQTVAVPPGLANYESPFSLPSDTNDDFDYTAIVTPKGPLHRADSSTTFTVICSR